MNKEPRLRRCLLLCCHFARNLAYHRARRNVDAPPLGDFWISADGNFIDIAVLEWCKILGDDRAEQGWRKVVTDSDNFYTTLLKTMKMDACDWTQLVKNIRTYRDKFIAHLDSDFIMTIPILDKALHSADFYYQWILENEFNEFNSTGFPLTLMDFYDERLIEAERVYSSVCCDQR